MFTELHYHTNREIRELDLAQKMAERRNDSLAAMRRPSLRTRMARIVFALAGTTQRHTTREGSGAEGRA